MFRIGCSMNLLTICVIMISGFMSSCGGSGAQTGQAAQDSTFTLNFPLACVLWQDCSISAFPDIDGNGNDAFCGNGTYPGHTGTDFATSWARMDQGLNVVAAHEGTVLFAYDGKYDRCTFVSSEAECRDPVSPHRPGLNEGDTVCSNRGDYCNGVSCYFCSSTGNYIVIRHASSGYSSLYGHLSRGSVAVHPGDTVKRGQIIARVGSSGYSGGPHLHFEVLDTGLHPLDPWSGPCIAGRASSLWSNQASLYAQ